MKKRKHYPRLRLNSGQHLRIRMVAAVLGVAVFLPVVLRLYQLMVVEYDRYAQLALRNQTRSTFVAADRGEIYDRNMNVLATSRSVENVYLDPHELKQSGADITAMCRELSRILEKPEQWLAQQAVDTKMRYKQIAAGIDVDTAARIRAYIHESGVAGIHLEPSSRRVYPFGTLAAQVIGFTNASGAGSEGIEAAYNSFLEGKAGKTVTTKGNNEMDMPFSYESYLAAQPGCSLILTLDATVQALLEKQMQDAIVRYDVQNGAFGMVMDVNTGQILAMATLGSYDPNAYQQIADGDTAAALERLRREYTALDPQSTAYAKARQAYQEALTQARLKQWRNRCISDGYEPGSTFKVLTLAAALDCGAVTLDTAFHCSGAEQIPGRAQRLHCWRSTGHGSQQTPQALQNSCNLAFAHIALKLGGERFYEYITRFGILEKTGIDLYGESKGIFFDKALVTDTDKWGTASLTSGSFGQTFKITPLQLVRAIASVVNGGKLLEPYLVEEIIDSRGNTVLRQEPTVVGTTVSQETSKLMRGLIESVVTQGTAKNASVSGYSIGGKTGTSEKIDVFDENGQRVQDKIVSFVGIAPMDDPQYIVLVALDTPSRQTGIYISGGVMAAPTVGAVMAQILPYLEVERTLSPEDPASVTVQMPDLTGLTAEQAEKELTGLSLSALIRGGGARIEGQIPAAGQPVPGGSQVILYLGETPPEDPVTVPDFMGMDRQQAAQTASAAGLYMLATGNPGREPGVQVSAQDIPQGRQVRPGAVITLEFTDSSAAD